MSTSETFTFNNVSISISIENRGDLAGMPDAQIKGIVEEIQAKLLQQAKRNKVIARRIAGWTREAIDAARVAEAPDLERIVVGVVPEMSGHTTGIIVAGRAVDGQFYVLGDHSIAGAPEECTERVAGVYRDYNADLIVGEASMTGDYLEKLLQLVDDGVRFKAVLTMRRALDRFEPTGALYEQGRVHHVGALASLESRMTAWTTQTAGTESQVNALVLAIIGLRGEDA